MGLGGFINLPGAAGGSWDWFLAGSWEAPHTATPRERGVRVSYRGFEATLFEAPGRLLGLTPGRFLGGSYFHAAHSG